MDIEETGRVQGFRGPVGNPSNTLHINIIGKPLGRLREREREREKEGKRDEGSRGRDKKK